MENVLIKSLFEFVRNGKSIKQKSEYKGIPITRIETIWDRNIDTEKFGYGNIFEEDIANYKDSLLTKGDILMSHINSPKHLGKSALYEGDPKKLIHGMNLLCLRPEKSKINPSFANYYFLTQHFSQNISKISNQSVNQASFSATRLKQLEIPLPKSDLENNNTKIQDRIVEVLDHAVALRDKTKRLLDEYDLLAQSIFLEMFGDPMNNNEEWEKKNLKQLGKVITGSTPSSRKQNMFNGPIPFVTPSDLDSNDNYRRSVTTKGAKNSRIVDSGALLVCCIGSTIGKRRMVKDTVAFNQQINAIQWNSLIHPYYGDAVFNWLKQEVIHRAILTTVPILKKSLFEEIECPVPPIDLQTQFAKKIELIEKQKEIAQQELQEAEDLFQTLLQKAFKGELVSTIPEKV